MRVRVTLLLAIAAMVVSAGCSGKKTFTTSAELTRVHIFGKDPKAPSMIDVEMHYTDCPGNVRRLVRGDKNFSACALGFKKGDVVPLKVELRYDFERSQYRSDVLRIGECDIKVDPKDEANYEIVERCDELKATGNAVGVHCSRKRSDEMVAKCPWLRRN